jgi:hypothetical protein
MTVHVTNLVTAGDAFVTALKSQPEPRGQALSSLRSSIESTLVNGLTGHTDNTAATARDEDTLSDVVTYLTAVIATITP